MQKYRVQLEWQDHHTTDLELYASNIHKAAQCAVQFFTLLCNTTPPKVTTVRRIRVDTSLYMP